MTIRAGIFPQDKDREPDPAILAIARALARQQAREDHAAELARANNEPTDALETRAQA